jgi:hypothetical protein
MRSFMIRVLFAIWMATALSASANDVLFLSTSDIDPGPAPVGTSSTITLTSLGSHTLYIWVTDGTQVTPPVTSPPITPFWPAFLPPSVAYFSYDLGVTGPLASAISLTDASIANPVILDSSGNPLQRDTDWDGGSSPAATVTRWSAASHFTVDGSHVSPSAITGLNATTLPMPTTSTGTPTGVDTHIHTGLSTSPNDLYSGAQPGYSAAAHAFLLGEVSFTVNSFNSPGDTVLHILPSSLNASGAAIGYSYSTGGPAPNFTSAYVDLASNYNLATDVVVYAKGDWNHDGEATVADIAVMSAAMGDLAAYSGNSLSPTRLAAIGDFDDSGAVEDTDVQSLICLVANGSGSGTLTAVPEPAAWVLLMGGMAATVWPGCRRWGVVYRPFGMIRQLQRRSACN